MSDASTKTPTIKHSELWGTGGSGSFTYACDTAPSTTNPPLGRTAKPQQLDKLDPWDVEVV